jgi:cell division protein FtsI (penicillin-binding protein 3)
MAESSNLKRRIFIRSIIVSVGLLLFSIAIAARIVYVQRVEGKEWKDRAENSRYRIIPATRGNIFSDDGSLLVTSVPEYRVGIDLSVTVRHAADSAHFFKNLDSLSIHLGKILKEPSSTIRRRIVQGRNNLLQVMAYNQAQTDTAKWETEPRYLSISPTPITYEKKKWLFEQTKWAVLRKATAEEKKKDKELERRVFRFRWMPLDSVKLFSTGLNFELVPNRDKPFGNTASRLLGRTDDSLVKDPQGSVVAVMRGATGIEKSFNGMLVGQEGHGWFENLRGSWRPINEEDSHHAVPGLDLYTTLNVNMQDVTEAALLKAVKRYKAKYGVAIVMETQTGEIKALANLHHTRDSTYVDDQNFAVNYRIAPGSTFKLATMMSVFEETKASPNDLVNTTGGQYLHLHDSNNRGYGIISLYGAFIRSSNTGMARTLVQYFGSKPNTFVDYLHKFHLADKLDFQVEVSRGNEKPEVHRPGDRLWSNKSLPTMAIGEELRISAMQMLAYYNAVANNGYWIQPIVVKTAKRGELVERDFTQTQRRDTQKICSERTLGIVKKMLEGVLEDANGTARSIAPLTYRIAGKTGTSIKFDGKKKTRLYYSSFAGYFPAEKPRYTIFVALDEPHNPETGMSAYGGTAAAPVFREIADKVRALDLQMHRTLRGKALLTSEWQNELGNAHPSDLRQIASGLGIPTNASGWDEAPRGSTRKVPNLKGMSLRDALYVLENRGYRVRYTGRGHVFAQSLEPGTDPVDKSIVLELK